MLTPDSDMDPTPFAVPSLQHPSTWLDAETALIADLNRLLREGFASVEWVDTDVPPRFHVTEAGQAYLETTAETTTITRALTIRVIP
jgi:hypothetical protein